MTAGSVVHGALQVWLGRESWTACEPLAELRSALTQVEVARGTRLTDLPSGGRALRSLRSIATQLSEILAEEGARFRDRSIEAPLVSTVDRLWGVPDLVVTAARTLIIDFKTGLESIDAAGAAHRQLMFYAYLLKSAAGLAADELVVLSPTRAHRMPCDAEQVDGYVAKLCMLREAKARIAAPDRHVCTYCPLRSRCEPHWEAVEEWEPDDAVRGQLLAVATSMSGVRSLTLHSESATKVLVSVPRTVRMPDLSVGDHVRLVRVHREPAAGQWRAGRTTVISRAG